MPFLLLLVLGFCALAAGCTGSGAVNPLTPQQATVADTASASSSDVIYWTSFPVTFANSDSLNGVDLVSSKSGWACGNNGLILRYDGQTWSKVKLGLAQSENFMAVGFADDGNGWIVGTHGAILGYKGGSWSLAPSPTQQNLYGLTVLPDRTAWAVGANGTLLRYNGVSWSVVDLGKLDPPVTDDLNDVNLSDSNNGWAVGNNGVILRYDGQSWKPFAAPPTTERLNSVSTLNNLQAWIVGAYGTILRFNGTTWSSLGTAFSGFDLYQVFMRGESDGWAVGQNGTILYYDGSRWISHPKPDSKPSLNALSFSGDTGFAMGQAGAIYQFHAKGESPQFSFLFKGELSKPTAPDQAVTLTYTVLNQTLKTSPEVSLELDLPKGFKPLVEGTPTPGPSVSPTPAASPTSTPQPSLTPGVPLPGVAGRTLASTASIALTSGWKLDGDKVRWDLGPMASSELKTLALRFQAPKDPKKPAVFKASLKFQDQDVADAQPVTLGGGAVPTPEASVTPSPTP